MIHPESIASAVASSVFDLVGIGLRSAHYRELMTAPRQVGWLEVHSENYFADGGFDLYALEALRSTYPVSLHGVGAALGSAQSLCLEHLGALRRLCERVQPFLVSEHLSWARVGERHFNELLPLPRTTHSLAHICRQVQQMQDSLGRQVLLENVCSYVRFHSDTMTPAEFMNELASRSGCGLLIDINNAYIDQINLGTDARDFLLTVDPHHVKEVHLAGSTVNGGLIIDDHGAEVAEPVWALYADVIHRFGGVPALVEWDHNLPELETLLNEASRARKLLSNNLEHADEVA